MSQNDPLQQQAVVVARYTQDRHTTFEDLVTVEEPLEIRLIFPAISTDLQANFVSKQSRTIAITMRTPGNDSELAIGFLASEGILKNKTQILGIRPTKRNQNDSIPNNLVEVELSENCQFDFQQLQRHFSINSSCGVCGKTSMDAVKSIGIVCCTKSNYITKEIIFDLPERLKRSQTLFRKTGGIHGAGLFDINGQLLECREDVGRHNAVDKVLGCRMLSDHDHPNRAAPILVVSGRASFELVQKAIVASLEVMVAVGAPSSLAVETAREFGLTLVGFAAKNQFNVYSHAHRITN